MCLSLPFDFSPETQDAGRREGRQGWSEATSKGSGWALPNSSISVLKNQKPVTSGPGGQAQQREVQKEQISRARESVVLEELNDQRGRAQGTGGG